MVTFKILFKAGQWFIVTWYGYNLFDLVTDALGKNTTPDLVSESAQTGFAIGGLIVMFIKIADMILKINHRIKMDRLDRRAKKQELDRLDIISKNEDIS